MQVPLDPVPVASSIQMVSSLASKAAAPRMEDALLAFVNDTAKDNGTGIIGRSGTSHSMLGASGNEFDFTNGLR